MKAFIGLGAVVLLGVLLRLNLPSNEITAKDISVKNPGAIFIWQGMLAAANDFHVSDFIVLKTACSKLHKVSLIAIPFQKWTLLKKDVSSCD